MSRLTVAMQNDLKLLAMLRDELALQAHLLKADMKDRWQGLEVKWGELRGQAERAETAGSDALHESEVAMRLLADSLRKGYDDVRKTLKH